MTASIIAGFVLLMASPIRNEDTVEERSHTAAPMNTPAHQTARKLMRGINLGNHLESPPGHDWGASYSRADLRVIRREGFDHIRLPVAWHYHMGPAPEFSLSNTIYAAADVLVTDALAEGLGVIITVHHFNRFTADPHAQSNALRAIWHQLGNHYAKAPPQLVFELLNEPNDAATTDVMNPIYAGLIRMIRQSNPDRTLLVGPGNWCHIDELVNLKLPADDTNLIATVHCYEPFYFTHQGASWSGPDVGTTGIQFPGPPDQPLAPAPGVAVWVTNWITAYNTVPTATNPCSPHAFRSGLARAKAWSLETGRPVHIGEFGCYARYCDDSSRVTFTRTFREAADAVGLGWAMWDWKAGFHYWKGTPQDGAPDPPGMREALFPEVTRESHLGQHTRP